MDCRVRDPMAPMATKAPQGAAWYHSLRFDSPLLRPDCLFVCPTVCSSGILVCLIILMMSSHED